MDEAMVERWNSKVKPEDTIYHLGDVVINRKSLAVVKRLNGRKILIRGNHDLFSDKDYYEAGFVSLRGVHVVPGKYVFTHIPVHPAEIRRFRVNVHGHLHGNQVMQEVVDEEKSSSFCNDSLVFKVQPDPRYMSACVEQTDFAPLHFDELEERIQKRWTETGYVEPDGAAFGNGSGPG